MSSPERPGPLTPGRSTRRREGGPSSSEAGSRGREPLDVGPVDRPVPFPLYEVRNPTHRTRYLVALPEFPERLGSLCSCEDFARRGRGTCKHIEAAWLFARAQPPANLPSLDSGWADSVWVDVDRRQSGPLPGRGAGPRELRRAGRALIDAREPYASAPEPPKGRPPPPD